MPPARNLRNRLTARAVTVTKAAGRLKKHPYSRNEWGSLLAVVKAGYIDVLKLGPLMAEEKEGTDGRQGNPGIDSGETPAQPQD